MFEKVFNAVPGDKLNWKPEPKARSARELIGHLIGHEQDLDELLTGGEIHHRNPLLPMGRKYVLSWPPRRLLGPILIGLPGFPMSRLTTEVTRAGGS